MEIAFLIIYNLFILAILGYFSGYPGVLGGITGIALYHFLLKGLF